MKPKKVTYMIVVRRKKIEISEINTQDLKKGSMEIN